MNKRSFTSALLLGVTAGLRTMTAPASLALAQQAPGAGRNWLLETPQARRILTALAIGELIFDKLPFAPNRTSMVGLTGRLLSGGMCGAVAAPEDEATGALLGMAGALVGSFAGFAMRRRVARASGLPTLVAIAEDGLAIGIGLVAASQSRPEEVEFERPNRYAA